MFTKPKDAIRFAKEKLHQNGVEVFSGKWQSIDVEQPMVELLNHTIKFVIPDNMVQVIDEVRPNLPWAKDHLNERVGGEPLNPPPSNEWFTFFIHQGLVGHVMLSTSACAGTSRNF